MRTRTLPPEYGAIAEAIPAGASNRDAAACLPARRVTQGFLYGMRQTGKLLWDEP